MAELTTSPTMGSLNAEPSAFSFLGSSSGIGGDEQAVVSFDQLVGHTRRRESALARRNKRMHEQSYLTNSRALVAGLTLEHLRDDLLPAWKALEDNSFFARGGARMGLTAEQFVEVVGRVVQVRFPDLSTLVIPAMLNDLFEKMDASCSGYVNWNTFVVYLIDTVDEVAAGANPGSPSAGSPMGSPTAAPWSAPNQNANAAKQSGTGEGKGDEEDDDAAEEVGHGEMYQLTPDDERLTNINTAATTVDFVGHMVSLEPLPQIACITRQGAIHFLHSQSMKLQRTTRFRGTCSTAMYVHTRTLDQSMPGMFAVTSFIALTTQQLKLHIFPGKFFHLRSVTPTPQLICCMAYSKYDGLLYGGGRDGKLFAWAISPKGIPRLFRTFALHSDGIFDMMFLSKDAATLITASADTTVAEYSLHREPWHTLDVQKIASGEPLVKVNEPRMFMDTVVQVPATPPNQVTTMPMSQNHVAYFRGHTSSVLSVTYSAAQKLIITTGADGSCLCFVEGFSSVPAYRIDDLANPHQGGMVHCSVDATGVFLMTFDDHNLGKVFDLRTMQCIDSVHLVPFSQSKTIRAVCGVTLKTSGCVFINTNSQCHCYQLENPTDAVAGCVFEDSQDAVVAIKVHPLIPTTLVAVNTSSVVLWCTMRQRRLATHKAVFAVITAAAIDPRGHSFVAGSAFGELGVFRLDTGRPLRQYQLPGNSGEVSVVQYAVKTGQIVAVTERRHFVLCEDSGENEFGKLAPLRIIACPMRVLRLIVCREAGVYIVTDQQHECRGIVYDTVDNKIRVKSFMHRADHLIAGGAGRSQKQSSISQRNNAVSRRRRNRLKSKHKLMHDTEGSFSAEPGAAKGGRQPAAGKKGSTPAVSAELGGEFAVPAMEKMAKTLVDDDVECVALCPMGPYPACIVASTDGFLQIVCLKPHILQGECVCRWENHADLVNLKEELGNASAAAKRKASRRGSMSARGATSGGEQPRSARNRPRATSFMDIPEVQESSSPAVPQKETPRQRDGTQSDNDSLSGSVHRTNSGPRLNGNGDEAPELKVGDARAERKSARGEGTGERHNSFRGRVRETSAAPSEGGASSDGEESEESTRLPPVVLHMQWIHPYTLLVADEWRRLVIYDLSDVVLQCRLFDASKKNAPSMGNDVLVAGDGHSPSKPQAKAKPLWFHTVLRPPIIRCVAQLRTERPINAMTLLKPNCIVCLDDKSKPSYFAMVEGEIMRLTAIPASTWGTRKLEEWDPEATRQQEAAAIEEAKQRASTHRRSSLNTSALQPSASLAHHQQHSRKSVAGSVVTFHAAPRPARQRWRKYANLFRVLWLLTKFLALSKEETMEANANFVAGMAATTNIAAAHGEKISKKFPFMTSKACLVGLAAGEDGPNFLCLSFDWCREIHAVAIEGEDLDSMNGSSTFANMIFGRHHVDLSGQQQQKHGPRFRAQLAGTRAVGGDDAAAKVIERNMALTGEGVRNVSEAAVTKSTELDRSTAHLRLGEEMQLAEERRREAQERIVKDAASRKMFRRRKLISDDDSDAICSSEGSDSDAADAPSPLKRGNSRMPRRVKSMRQIREEETAHLEATKAKARHEMLSKHTPAYGKIDETRIVDRSPSIAPAPGSPRVATPASSHHDSSPSLSESPVALTSALPPALRGEASDVRNSSFASASDIIEEDRTADTVADERVEAALLASLQSSVLLDSTSSNTDLVGSAVVALRSRRSSRPTSAQLQRRGSDPTSARQIREADARADPVLDSRFFFEDRDGDYQERQDRLRKESQRYFMSAEERFEWQKETKVKLKMKKRPSSAIPRSGSVAPAGAGAESSSEHQPVGALAMASKRRSTVKFRSTGLFAPPQRVELKPSERLPMAAMQPPDVLPARHEGGTGPLVGTDSRDETRSSASAVRRVSEPFTTVPRPSSAPPTSAPPPTAMNQSNVNTTTGGNNDAEAESTFMFLTSGSQGMSPSRLALHPEARVASPANTPGKPPLKTGMLRGKAARLRNEAVSEIEQSLNRTAKHDQRGDFIASKAAVRTMRR